MGYKTDILMGRPAKKEPKKFCKTCGVELTRQRFSNGRLEDLTVFMRRQHCSRTCGNSRKVLTKHGYSWRARKHIQKSCEACGYTKSLQAHHIDQDKTNNEAENIQTLCKHCHDFWHTTQKRLGKNIAGRMPPLYPNNGMI